MNMVKSDTCIVYYSRSGHSHRLAKNLAKRLHGHLVEIQAPAYQRGIVSYVRAAMDSLRQRDMASRQGLPSVSGCNRVVLCGPVWTSYPAVPLRTFLRTKFKAPSTVGLFLTSGAHSPPQKAFQAAESDLGRPISAKACLPNGVEGTAEESSMVDAFLSDLEGAVRLTSVN